MKPEERIKEWQLHDSMRGHFGFELYKTMVKNTDIILLVGDLGYKLFDNHFEDMPDRCINCGASEQNMMDIAVGLAIQGCIPVVYSITPFLIFRPFETLRTYINHENIKVLLIGSGRDKDYKHDGFSHDASDVKEILSTLPSVIQYYPESKEEIPTVLNEMVSASAPSFLSLKR